MNETDILKEIEYMLKSRHRELHESRDSLINRLKNDRNGLSVLQGSNIDRLIGEISVLESLRDNLANKSK